MKNDWEIAEINESLASLRRAIKEEDVDSYNQAIMTIEENARNLVCIAEAADFKAEE